MHGLGKYDELKGYDESEKILLARFSVLRAQGCSCYLIIIILMNMILFLTASRSLILSCLDKCQDKTEGHTEDRRNIKGLGIPSENESLLEIGLLTENVPVLTLQFALIFVVLRYLSSVIESRLQSLVKHYTFSL